MSIPLDKLDKILNRDIGENFFKKFKKEQEEQDRIKKINAETILFLLNEKNFSFETLLANSKLSKTDGTNGTPFEIEGYDYFLLVDYAKHYGEKIFDLEKSIQFLKSIDIYDRDEILEILNNNSVIYLIKDKTQNYLLYFNWDNPVFAKINKTFSVE